MLAEAAELYIFLMMHPVCAPGTPYSEGSMDSLGVVEIESAQPI